MEHRTPLRLRPERPALVFGPLAWLKLQWFCHRGNTEVGGFGLSAERDSLFVEEFTTVRQYVTPVGVRFDDEAVADYFDQCVDRGLPPERFARLWLHSHPGASPLPSGTDEETFANQFGRCDWALMGIISRGGQSYARLTFSAGPGGQVLLAVTVDWADWPAALARAGGLNAQVARWQDEYDAHVLPQGPSPVVPVNEGGQDRPWWEVEPWHTELDDIRYEPTHRGEAHEYPF